MRVLRINKAYLKSLESLGLTTLAALRARCASLAASGSSVEIAPVRLQPPSGGPLDVFCKHYKFPRPNWRFLGRASKARCEFRNLQRLQRLGLRAADPVVCGSWRDHWGRLQGAFIATRSIPDALTLVEFWRSHCADLTTAGSRALRSTLARQLAEITRRMHDAGFFHRDLYWRNVLVTRQPACDPVLWLIDCPRGHVHWLPLPGLRRHHVVMDLASLDRWAHRLCTPTERLRFIRHYLGAEASASEVKALARRVQAYRLRRWREPDREAATTS
jgi:tRNA A-37 threonylcarbamoyl transferase component Bud32